MEVYVLERKEAPSELRYFGVQCCKFHNATIFSWALKFSTEEDAENFKSALKELALNDNKINFNAAEFEVKGHIICGGNNHPTEE